MKNPVRRIAVRFLAVAVVAVLCSSGLAADPPVKPGDGFGVFLVVFRQMYEGSDQGQGRLDVAKFGGVEHEKRDGVLVVTLPLQAWADVEAHPDVAYVQRVWMGEPLDDWTAGRVRKDRLRTSTNATPEAEVQAAVWDSADYAYDGSGNITAIGSDQYAYDSAGRIIQSTVGGVAETYGYDSFGNLVARTTGTRAAPIPPVDPGSNRFTGYRYDAAGNVLSLPGSGVTLAERASSYEYDSLGMPTTVSGHTRASETRRMIYTADDERIASIEDGDNSSAKIWLRGFDGKVLREYSGKLTSSNWVWVQDYVYASGQLLAAERESANGGRLHFHLDHLGSTRLITKADKTELSSHRFFPFGVEQSDSTYEVKNFDLSPWRLEPMKFTGHERDFYGPLNVDGTDHLDYMHARFYDPGVGRFLSVDPGKDWDLRQPQSWNLYAYVRNNPINKTDPTGKCGEPAGFIGPTKPCMVVAKEAAMAAHKATVKFLDTHDITLSAGLSASGMGGVLGGGVEVRTVADSRGTVGLRFSVINRVGAGASVAANSVAGIELNSAIKSGPQQSAQLTAEGGKIIGGGGSVGLDSSGSLSFAKDFAIRAGLELGGAVTLDGVTSYTFAFNVLGKQVEPATVVTTQATEPCGDSTTCPP